VHQAHQTIEHVARTAYGRLVAYLSSRTRDVAAAEDALGEALLEALTAWPRNGVPDQPEAWLMKAAGHRLLDHQRHLRTQERHAEALRSKATEASAFEAPVEYPDERLHMFFVCAHPAIDVAVRAPLMLQVVLGLDAARIAPAFLVSPATMSQRLVRAKTKIREAGIAFAVPEEHDLPQRLESVLEAIYAAYGLSWDGGHGPDGPARDIAEDAVWLARVLAQRMPDEPEVRGILALLLFCESRQQARRTELGDYVPLSEQDPRKWSEALIREAEVELSTAASRGRPHGRFQLEAAIQSVHADRRRTGRTDWQAVALFYEHIVRLAPTLASRIGYAVAIAEVQGSEAGLGLLDRIESTSTASHQPFWAARAHLLARMGRSEEAARAYDRAIGLAREESVRLFLMQRRG